MRPARAWPRALAALAPGALVLLPAAAPAQEPAPRAAPAPAPSYDELLRWEGERDGTLGPTGRRLYAERLERAPGLRGRFAYGGPASALIDPLQVELYRDGARLDLAPLGTTWFPSHTLAVWEADGVLLEERKLVSDDDALIDCLRVTSTARAEQDLELYLHAATTPLLERFRSRQVALDLAPAANLAFDAELADGIAPTVLVAPGTTVYDGVRFVVPEPARAAGPVLVGLRGADAGDAAARLPERVELALPDLRPAVVTLHLLVAAPAPRGGSAADSPAACELVLDDRSLERVPWPAPGAPPAAPHERREWRRLLPPGAGEPALRLAWRAPPGRAALRLRLVKGAGDAVPVLLAATCEVPPPTGRLPLLLGEHEYAGEPLHLALAGSDCVPAAAPGGERALLRRVHLAPGASVSTTAVVACGARRLATALRALGSAETDADEVFARHAREYRGWFERNAPRFTCSDELLERTWHYRWFLVRHALRRLDLPQFSLPVFVESARGARHAAVTLSATPHVVAETRWLRDPDLAQGPLRALLVQQGRDGLLRDVRLGPPDAEREARRPAPHRLGAAAVGAWEVNGRTRYLEEDLGLLERDLWATLGLDGGADGGAGEAIDGLDDLRVADLERGSFAFLSARALARGRRALGDGARAEQLERLAAAVRASVQSDLADAALARAQHESGRYAILAPLLAGLIPIPEADELARLAQPAALGTAVPEELTLAAELLALAARSDPAAAPPGALSLLLRLYARRHFADDQGRRALLRLNGVPWSHEGAPDGFRSAFNDLLIRFVGGLVPRADDTIELWPLVRDLQHFRFRDVPYHGLLLDIAWDRPDGARVHADRPEGFTLAVDGRQVLHVAELDRVEVAPGE